MVTDAFREADTSRGESNIGVKRFYDMLDTTKYPICKG